MSPSSQRAWIEIGWPPDRADLCRVALLAEGVDRNDKSIEHTKDRLESPSSQRAWIEICLARRAARRRWVALLAEGVDRNPKDGVRLAYFGSRPPRRGRG